MKKPEEQITTLDDDKFNWKEGDLIIKMPEKNIPEKD